MVNFFAVVGLMLLSTFSFSQTEGLGSWKDYLPYREAVSLCKVGPVFYVASTYGVFSYNTDDQSIERFNKVNALSDVRISCMTYNKASDLLIIGYENGNLDLLRDGQAVNLPAILNNSITGDKRINTMHNEGVLTYLCTGFGIVVLNTTKQEIKDTYKIGPNNEPISINGLTIDNQHIYAATDIGLLYAKKSSEFLGDYKEWTNMTTVPNAGGKFNHVALYQDELIASYATPSDTVDTIYRRKPDLTWEVLPNSVLGRRTRALTVSGDKLLIATNYDDKEEDNNDPATIVLDAKFEIVNWFSSLGDGLGVMRANDLIYVDTTLWFADQNQGFGVIQLNHWGRIISPEGPYTTSLMRMDIVNNELWIATGAVNGDLYNNTYAKEGVYRYIDDKWDRIGAFDPNNVFDFVCVAADPNKPNHGFVGTVSVVPMIEYNSTSPTYYWPDSTQSSPFKTRYNSEIISDVTGMAYDNKGNLWITNSFTSKPLIKRTPGGAWESYACGTEIKNAAISDVRLDKSGNKWMLASRKGIAGFNDNNTSKTSDDDFVFLSTGIGNGNLPSEHVRSFAFDKDGEMWIGFTGGLAVLYSPESALQGGDKEVQQILIEQDGNIQVLLETETITSIEVDHGNRKWIGTENSGVYLLSPDGEQTIYHFTKDNSPLFSNLIIDIAINHENGEVFIGTDKGLLSFTSLATTSGQQFSDEVFAFPNPIKPDYNGHVVIKGLASDSDIKITDVSGNLIHETTSVGGQAKWNVKDYDGNRVSSGVYLVFGTIEDGTESVVTKIMVVN